MKFVPYQSWLDEAAAGISFEETAPARFSLRPAPRLLFGVPSPEFGGWFFGDRGVQQTGLLRIDRAALLGCDVLARDGVGINILQCGFVHADDPLSFDQRAAGDRLAPRDFTGEWVLLPGPAYGMYGHWLVDFLPRLYNLVVLGFDPTRLRLLLPSDLPERNRAWLAMLGIASAAIATYDPAQEYCRVEHALIPFGLRGNSRAQPMLGEAANWMRRGAVARADPEPDSGPGDGPHSPAAERRLFVSRRAWGNASRILLNEDELSGLAAQAGFEIVIPETLSVADQVRLFAEASLIVGDYGSALHNSLFAPAGGMVLNLRGRFGHPGFLQSGLCEAAGQDCGYMFAETNGTEDRQRYSVPPDDFRQCLDLMLSLPR